MVFFLGEMFAGWCVFVVFCIVDFYFLVTLKEPKFSFKVEMIVERVFL